MLRKSCAVAMRNAILKNKLNIKFNVNFKDIYTLTVQHILWLLHQLQAVIIILHIVSLVDITNDRCRMLKNEIRLLFSSAYYINKHELFVSYMVCPLSIALLKLTT